jgi:hypothetical protein
MTKKTEETRRNHPEHDGRTAIHCLYFHFLAAPPKLRRSGGRDLGRSIAVVTSCLGPQCKQKDQGAHQQQHHGSPPVVRRHSGIYGQTLLHSHFTICWNPELVSVLHESCAIRCKADLISAFFFSLWHINPILKPPKNPRLCLIQATISSAAWDKSAASNPLGANLVTL